MKRIAIISMLCLSLSWQGTHASQPQQFFDQAKSTVKTLWASKGVKVALGISLLILTTATATFFIVRSRRTSQQPTLLPGNQGQEGTPIQVVLTTPPASPQKAEITPASESKITPRRAADIPEEPRPATPYRAQYLSKILPGMSSQHEQINTFIEAANSIKPEMIEEQVKTISSTSELFRQIAESSDGLEIIAARKRGEKVPLRKP